MRHAAILPPRVGGEVPRHMVPRVTILRPFQLKPQETTPMANRDNNVRPDAIGYKKPPRHTQYQPGQTGNPRGRPKRNDDLASILAEMIEQRAEVTERGRSYSITKLHATVQKLVNKAAAGDPRATGQLLNLMRSLPSRNDIVVAPEQSFTEADREVLRAIFARLAATKHEDDQ